MAYRLTLITAIVLVFAGGIWAKRRLGVPPRPEYVPRWQCRRIVSMAPSITETLFALGAGDRLVGVSKFCEYPPEVRELPRVGGYFDPNLEAVLMLKPDLVIMLEEQAESLPSLEELDLQTLMVNHQTIDGIIDSFRSIGRRCEVGEEGRWMARQYRRRLERIRAITQRLPRPSVLFVLGRNHHGGRLEDVFVAGADDYFDTIMELAGGRNACRVQSVRNPVVSQEGIIWLDPQVIVDLVRTADLEKDGRRAIVERWRKELPRVRAVEDDRVLIFDQQFARVPGPRFIQLLETLARELHPQADWGDYEE